MWSGNHCTVHVRRTTVRWTLISPSPISLPQTTLTFRNSSTTPSTSSIRSLPANDTWYPQLSTDWGSLTLFPSPSLPWSSRAIIILMITQGPYYSVSSKEREPPPRRLWKCWERIQDWLRSRSETSSRTREAELDLFVIFCECYF